MCKRCYCTLCEAARVRARLARRLFLKYETAPFSKQEFRRELSYAMGYGSSPYKLRNYWQSMEKNGLIDVNNNYATLTESVILSSGIFDEPDCIHTLANQTCFICGSTYQTRKGLQNHYAIVHELDDDSIAAALGYQEVVSE